MASQTSHHDESRKGVGLTAHVCAYIRAQETKKGPNHRLIVDPYAHSLAGVVAENYFAKAGYIGWYILFSDQGRFLLWMLSPFLQSNANLGMIDAMIVRTKFIDDEMTRSMVVDKFDQVCVLGSGLDSRPWRLKFIDSDNESLKNIDYFEMDFPELFNYKLPILAAHNATSVFNYRSVACDLSLPTWSISLLNAGFDCTKKTLWLMEGFTGYLEEHELRSLLKTISQDLSADCSKLVATFIKPSANKLSMTTTMHKYRPPTPVDLVAEYGWQGVEEDFEDVGARLNKVISPVGSIRGNVFVVAELKERVRSNTE